MDDCKVIKHVIIANWWVPTPPGTHIISHLTAKLIAHTVCISNLGIHTLKNNATTHSRSIYLKKTFTHARNISNYSHVYRLKLPKKIIKKKYIPIAIILKVRYYVFKVN